MPTTRAPGRRAAGRPLKSPLAVAAGHSRPPGASAPDDGSPVVPRVVLYAAAALRDEANRVANAIARIIGSGMNADIRHRAHHPPQEPERPGRTPLPQGRPGRPGTDRNSPTRPLGRPAQRPGRPGQRSTSCRPTA
jgi:hypothetical protein